MAMSRRDYEVLASALNRAYNAPPISNADQRHSHCNKLGVLHAANSIADVLGASNYRFDRNKFLDWVQFGPPTGSPDS